jgi:hypothetical protein
MIARGSFVLLLFFSGAVLPLLVCASTSTALYQEDASTTTTTLAAAVDVPAAVTEHRHQHPRSSLLLRRNGGEEDAVFGAETDQEHRRRRLRTTSNMTARRMQQLVYNPTTGRYEEEPETTSYTIFLPIIPVVLAFLGLCCYCQKQEQWQQQAETAAQRRVVQEAIQSSSTPRIISKQGRVVPSPPRLVTAAATKFAPQSRCGVAFAGSDYAQITRILSDSIFAGTELEPGMKIVSINNIPIHSTHQAVATLSAAPDVVTIVAHSAGYYGSTDNLVVATIVKDRPDQPMGISYKRDVGHGPIVLGMFPTTSLLLRGSNPSSSDVTPGMEVLTINNIHLRSNAQAAEVTRSAFPLVTILARRRSAAGLVAPSVTTEGGMVMVEAEPVTSYSLSSRDDPIVATAVATPVASYSMSSSRDDPIVATARR